MQLELRHLRLLTAIAEARSVAGGARAVFTSQPNGVTQLARIEAELGERIFDRSPHGAVPTPFGEEVLDRAARILAEVDALTSAAASRAGSLSLGANVSSHNGLLLATLAERLPETRINPRTDVSTTAVMRWLVQGAVDVADVGVVPGYDDELRDAALEQRTYVENARFLVALGEDHPMADRLHVALRDLEDTPWVLPPEEPDGFVHAVRDAFVAAGFEPRQEVGPTHVSETMHYIAARGNAVLVTPSFVPPRGVVVVPVSDPLLVGRRVVRWRRSKVSNEQARRIVDAAAETYRQRLEEVSELSWWDRLPSHRPRVVGSSAAPDQDTR